MQRTFKVCDHCGESKDTIVNEFKTVGMELCSDCEPLLLTHIEAFCVVNQITATAYFKDSGMKPI